MRDFGGKRSVVPSGNEPVVTARPGPGKHTLVESLPAAGTPVQRKVDATVSVTPAGPRPAFDALLRGVQRKAEGAELETSGIHAVAQRGIETAASPLPHLDRIQRLFGRHDISGIKAHVGGAAAASARALGAAAYATGEHVVLGTGADLHTVAHEAAHVVQQRAGVQLQGGVGEVGDAHEQHADQVADAVVRAESAEALLTAHGTAAARAPSAIVQRSRWPAKMNLEPPHDQKGGKRRREEPSGRAATTNPVGRAGEAGAHKRHWRADEEEDEEEEVKAEQPAVIAEKGDAAEAAVKTEARDDCEASAHRPSGRRNAARAIAKTNFEKNHVLTIGTSFNTRSVIDALLDQAIARFPKAGSKGSGIPASTYFAMTKHQLDSFNHNISNAYFLNHSYELAVSVRIENKPGVIFFRYEAYGRGTFNGNGVHGNVTPNGGQLERGARFESKPKNITFAD